MSKKDATAKEEPGTEEQPAGKGKKKLVMLIAIVALMAAGGGGAAWYFLRPHSQHEAAKPEKPPVFVQLEQFTVNLQPDEGDQYLQTALTLKVADNETVDLLKLHMPELRNRILLLLSSKKASQIATLDGKQRLAEELAAQARLPFSAGGTPQAVATVLFTSFVVQ
jgi:flagellar FliL protein